MVTQVQVHLQRYTYTCITVVRPGDLYMESQGSSLLGSGEGIDPRRCTVIVHAADTLTCRLPLSSPKLFLGLFQPLTVTAYHFTLPTVILFVSKFTVTQARGGHGCGRSAEQGTPLGRKP